jgi:hypothetical protein
MDFALAILGNRDPVQDRPFASEPQEKTLCSMARCSAGKGREAK